MRFDPKKSAIVGEAGSLPVIEEDVIAQKLTMLIEGECEGLGPIQAAAKFGYSKQRYFQIRELYTTLGSEGLANKRRGPKGNYRRTDEVVRQIIRHRFLDPNASPAVIAQKLRQTGMAISVRSIERVIEDFGLQKKTVQVPPPSRKRKRPP